MRSPRPIRFALSIVAVAVAASLSACGSSTLSGAPSQGSKPVPVTRGGTLTVLSKYSAETMALDPAKSWALATTSLGLIDRRLTTWKIGRSGAAQVIPDVATNAGIPSRGGRVWTYHIKRGIRFSNGKEITSQDFKYGVERTYAPALSGGINYQKPLIAGTKGYQGPFDGKQLSSIQTPDARTIVFHLNKPYGDWPWVVSTASMSPVPAGHAPAATFGQHPVTSGPYAVAHASSSEVEMVRNRYWRQSTDTTRTAGPDRIVFELNQDPTVEAQTLIADTSSAKTTFGADFVPPAQLAQVETNLSAKQRLITSPASPLEYLAVNMRSPRVRDRRVREALEYAVSRQAAIVASGGPVGASPATTLITPGIAGRRGYDMYPAGLTGNLVKARRLLAQAGDPHPTLTLVTENDPISLGIAQGVAQGYEQAGIHIAIRSLSEDGWTAVATGNKSGGYDISLNSWQPDYPSAEDNLVPLFDSSNIGNGNYNVSRLDDPAIDRMMARAEGTIDQRRANAIWARVDRRVMATGAVVPLVYNKNSFLRGSDVQNFYIGTFPAYPIYPQVSLDRR